MSPVGERGGRHLRPAVRTDSKPCSEHLRHERSTSPRDPLGLSTPERELPRQLVPPSHHPLQGKYSNSNTTSGPKAVQIASTVLSLFGPAMFWIRTSRRIWNTFYETFVARVTVVPQGQVSHRIEYQINLYNVF